MTSRDNRVEIGQLAHYGDTEAAAVLRSCMRNEQTAGFGREFPTESSTAALNMIGRQVLPLPFSNRGALQIGTWSLPQGQVPPATAQEFHFAARNHSSLPNASYMAFLEEKLALEQAKLQNLTQANQSFQMQQTFNCAPAGVHLREKARAPMATSRPFKKRRMPGPSLLIANRTTDGTWPLPRVARKEGIFSLSQEGVYRRNWIHFESQANSIYPNDKRKRNEYVKQRFKSYLARGPVTCRESAKK